MADRPQRTSSSRRASSQRPASSARPGRTGASPSASRGQAGRAPQTGRGRASRTATSASRSRVEGKARSNGSGKRPAGSRSSRSQRAYNDPALWTKDAPRPTARNGAASGVLRAVGRFSLALLALVGKGLAFLARAFAGLLSRSRIALAITVVALVVGVGCLVDFGMNAGKAYPGVHVGDVDASGKTVDEIAALLDQQYATRLAAGSAVVYASDDAQARAADSIKAAQDAALAEQLAVEEAQANKLAWTADANSLQAQLPTRDLAQQAVAVGRENGGLLARVGALFAGHTVEVHATYGQQALETLAADIDATIGNPRVDFGIAVTNGVAAVTDGHDGDMVNRQTLERELDQVLLGQPDGTGSFVARTEHAALRVDADAAQAVADGVNRAIADGARFSYEGSAWNASASDLGEWISTRIDQTDDGYRLTAFVDEGRAKPALLAHVETLGTDEPLHVTFQVDGDQVTALTDGTGAIPLAAEAATRLNDALFGDAGKAHVSNATAGPVEVGIESGAAPTSMSFDQAVDLGVVGTIAQYTTQFTTGAGTENRNHNIELVSQLLSNSVVAPGQTWSFNGTAGECNEEKGFLGAGAIVDGEYDDAVGGGICQVATTVFNAVYESGFPVKTRHNHSLYISSYPTGRDAAVSWPDLDLVWENDAPSDVLVRLSCADGQVTATLYGVDPGYQVSSTTSDWSEGKHYTTKTTVDESLSPGTSYVKTRGTDGRSITVIRTVADESGKVKHEDSFSSVYDPVTEVVVKGPDLADSETGGSSAGDASA